MRSKVALFASSLLLGTPVYSQGSVPTSSAQLEAQIALLQKQLAAAKEAEADKAIADEAAAKVKADAARAYLAGIGKPVGSAPADGGEAKAIAAAADAARTAGVTTTMTTKQDGTKETKVQPRTQEELSTSESSQVKFGGLDFGIGLAFSIDTGANDRVQDAALVNNIVRVNHSNNVSARLVLESHYLFTPDDILGITNIFGLRNADRMVDEQGESRLVSRARKEWGFGPFVAIQPGKDDIIDAVGAGLMFGLRRPGEGNDSFNIGLGLLYDVNARILGDGIQANKPLPVGETEIRYKTRDQKSVLVMTSYSF